MTTIQDKGLYDAIIFDLGGVIINLDFSRTLVKLQKLVSDLNAETFCGKEKQLSFYSDFETGSISTAEFLTQFNHYYHSSLSLSAFTDAWNAMILDFPLERIELIKKIAKLKRIFLLSNINAVHEEAVLNQYSLLSSESFYSIFEKVYYSHHVGMRKPDRKIFKHLIDENKLDPKRTLFIDDSKHHVLGASEEGIQAVHLSAPKTLERLFSEIAI